MADNGTDPTVREIAEQFRLDRKLYPHLGDRGLERVAVAIHPLVSQGLKQRIEALKFEAATIRQRPILGEDACMHVLANRPLRDEESVISRLGAGETLKDVLNDPTVWNPMHVRHVKTVVERVSRLCLYNGVDGSTFVDDSTFRHRVWQMALILQVCTDYGPDFDNAYEQVVAEMEVSQPNIKARIHGNRFSPEIKRKVLTTLERRYELLSLERPVRERRALLLQAAEADEVVYGFQQLPRSKRRRFLDNKVFAEPYESPVAKPGNPGEAEFNRIIANLKPPFSPGGAFVGMMSAGMVDPDHLLVANVKLEDDYALVTTPTSEFTSISGFDRQIHRPSGDSFSRITPRELGVSFIQARKGKKLDEVERAANQWLDGIVPGATVSKLRHALLYNGPIWLGYPSLFAYLGLAGRRPSMPGWEYYAHFDLVEEWPRLLSHFSRFCGPTCVVPRQPPRLCSASKCTPTLDVVRGMFKTLALLLSTPISSLDAFGLVTQWNGIAALTHLFTLAFAFLRNYPFQPPVLVQSEDGWRFIESLQLTYQKSLVVTSYEEPLRRLLTKVRGKWDEFEAALTAFGVELDYRGSHSRAYGFWSVPSQGARSPHPISCYQDPCGWQCCNGLLHCLETERYAGLHVNAMRHFTVATLLQSGLFSLTEVNWLHAHGLSVLQPMSGTRLEPGRTELLAEATSFLAKLLDWDCYL